MSSFFSQNRRTFLLRASLLTASLLVARISHASGKSNPVILFTSGWQDVNIGDIAHTPGLIALLKKRLPQAKLILWKRSRSEKVEAMLNHYYPDVRIIHGNVDATVPQSEAVKQAFEKADFFLRDWTFEIEQTTGAQLTERLMQVTKNYASAEQNVKKALITVDDRYDKTFRLLHETWLSVKN